MQLGGTRLLLVAHCYGTVSSVLEDCQGIGPGEILTYRNPGLGWRFGVAPLGGKWNMADYFYSPRPIVWLTLRTGDKRFGEVVQCCRVSCLHFGCAR